MSKQALNVDFCDVIIKNVLSHNVSIYHYDNTPMQYTAIFTAVKMIFR